MLQKDAESGELSVRVYVVAKLKECCVGFVRVKFVEQNRGPKKEENIELISDRVTAMYIEHQFPS